MHIIQEEIGPPKMSFQNASGQNNSDFTGVFSIEPLAPGFGHTLGNALRRVLLSSLPGASITAIKVSGATHEYSTLSGVKDSVLDIILNLKKIRFKKHSSEAEIVTLQKKGEGSVLAKDIKTSSDIEILNPDQIITTLDGKNTTLSIELKIEKGVGYLPVKERLQKQEDAEWILIDASFSPVQLVRYDVEPARVGERTNLDKLKLHITTDGSLTPEESIKFSAEVLQNYFDIFKLGSEESVESDFIADFSKAAQSDEEEVAEKESYTPIEILNLSPRTLNALINADIGSCEQLEKCTEAKLSTFRGFGKKAMDEVKDALDMRGLCLKEED